MRTTLILLLVALPAIAVADPTYDIGFRIGGYGFRREGDTSPGSWTECRMNGFGLFASRSLSGPLFVEAGLDTYFSSAFIAGAPSTDLPIDRMSALVSTAIGVRTDLAPWLRAYVQLGGGIELTRASLPEDGTTLRDQKAMPEGFFGVGLDLRVSRGLYLGASLRMLAMGNFDYAGMSMQAWNAPATSGALTASPDLASQGQFYVRRDL